VDKINDLAQFYKTLGDNTRLRLIHLLSNQEPGSALCVGCLAKVLDTSTSNISQHLRILKDMGLVIANRRGYRLHYFLDPNRFAEYDQLRREILEEPFTKPFKPRSTEDNTMCCKQNQNCKHPEQKPDPKDCTPEQIQKCHGEDAKHHCCEDQKAGS